MYILFPNAQHVMTRSRAYLRNIYYLDKVRLRYTVIKEDNTINGELFSISLMEAKCELINAFDELIHVITILTQAKKYIEKQNKIGCIGYQGVNRMLEFVFRI